MKYLIDGEVVDTYGGDFTYMDVRYEIVDGKSFLSLEAIIYSFLNVVL